MSSKTKKPTAPKWFKGMIYTKGETVTNPFSGESYDLTGLETSIYDYIIGCQMVFESAPSTMTKKRIDEFDKALNWFRVNNPEAYYVLLDQQQFSFHEHGTLQFKIRSARTHKVRAFRGMKQFLKFTVIWISQNLATPFWIVGHIHLSVNVYEDIYEILSSIGLNIIVAIGFYMDYKLNTNTNG